MNRSANSTYRPLISTEIAEKWQRIVNLMTTLIGAVDGWITFVHPEELEVFVSSQNPENRFKAQHRVRLNLGYFCETVMNKRQMLEVTDVRDDPDWHDAPEIAHGLFSYLGFPLEWPNGEIFGTICVHDTQEHHYTEASRALLREFRQVIETDLQIIVQIEQMRRMEEDFARNIADLKLAQRIAAIGNWTFDPEVGVPVWSDEVYKIYERNPQLGPPILEDYREIYERQDFERYWTAIQAAISEGKPYDIKLHLSLPGGKQKWIHEICEPEPERGPAGHLLRGTIQDISEIYHVQESLRVNEESFWTLLENSPDCLYVCTF